MTIKVIKKNERENVGCKCGICNLERVKAKKPVKVDIFALGLKWKNEVKQANEDRLRIDTLKFFGVFA